MKGNFEAGRSDLDISALLPYYQGWTSGQSSRYVPFVPRIRKANAGLPQTPSPWLIIRFKIPSSIAGAWMPTDHWPSAQTFHEALIAFYCDRDFSAPCAPNSPQHNATSPQSRVKDRSRLLCLAPGTASQSARNQSTSTSWPGQLNRDCM